MGQLNIYIDEDAWEKFKEIKLRLKYRTNQETAEQIILNVYKQLKNKSIATTSPQGNPS